MTWKNISLDEVAALTPETLADCINTLRYLNHEFNQYLKNDMMNMTHVPLALWRVENDIEQSKDLQAKTLLKGAKNDK